MKWREVQSLEELKKLGNLKSVAVLIQEELENQKVPKNSWNNLLNFITNFQDQLKEDVVVDEKGVEYGKINSIDELKKLGTFKEVKTNIEKQLKIRKIKVKSWQELYEFIILNNVRENKEEVASYESPYFKDEISEIIFYLLELEGDMKFSKLGITKLHFKEKDKAIYWKKELMKKIHPDQNTHKYAEEATKELNKIYGSMIKFAK